MKMMTVEEGVKQFASVSLGNMNLVDIITSKDDNIRNSSLSIYCENSASRERLLYQCDLLDNFVRSSDNLYFRVRALFFLSAIHRFHLDYDYDSLTGEIPYSGYKQLLERDFGGAIDTFLRVHKSQPNQALSSALARAYYNLGFQTLQDQVKSSVKNHDGNLWMFQLYEPRKHPKRIRPELMEGGSVVFREQTPVRMDLSHCCWSDIFFLGMDFPEGARVLNVSIDLSIMKKDNGNISPPIPPIETYIELITVPVLRLTSIDLKFSVDLHYISEVFDFCQDHLGLLKAGIIACGIVPPSLEGSTLPLSEIFETLIGRPGVGLHLTTKVNGIPKGSRLAVSTNLLASIISLGMRVTGQTKNIIGELSEDERKLVVVRATLGEWLGGSGGGWQDSGGIFPGIKLIEGVIAQTKDVEFNTSRGCLLPLHRQLSGTEAPPGLIKSLEESLVLVHGGMSQNVGPILEMVTEKYLLREANEWKARQEAVILLDDILDSFRQNDIQKLAKITTKNFFEPIQTIIPWASNLYTETLIARAKEMFKSDFFGFWMLGGCSGGGMGFIFHPKVKNLALDAMQNIMLKTKKEMEHSLPFAMDPVVYDFKINDSGTVASIFQGKVPSFSEGENSSAFCEGEKIKDLTQLLEELDFDEVKHENIRKSYSNGQIGLKQNRLSIDTFFSNTNPEDVIIARDSITPEIRALGESELRKGSVGVVSLAAGVGSRWNQGAGCVKALHPFCKFKGKHRSFLEIHLAKSRRISSKFGKSLPHVITTSYMTQEPVKKYLNRVKNHGYSGHIYQSYGTTVGLRLIPTIRDMKFMWEETNQQILDERAQKVKKSGQQALMDWAESCGEASDYRDNLPLQCIHPVGHYYEIPNMLLNGTLQKMLLDRPQLKYLMLHNIDTIGADVDPGILGLFLQRGSTLLFEVIPREIDDVGGGLARVNGKKVQLIEGLALPREEDAFAFTYYNSMTTWIDIDKLLKSIGINRGDLENTKIVASALHKFEQRIPTYVTLKEVKKRWGKGQEDIFPTVQFEKLWSDLSSLDDIDCEYVAVSRARGSQLKDQAQLDDWVRDGSSIYVEKLCSFDEL